MEWGGGSIILNLIQNSKVCKLNKIIILIVII